MPDRTYLHPIDPELRPGARNAIDTCLRLKPQERITIITDTVTRGIAAALPADDPRTEVLRDAAERHLAAGLSGLGSGQYVGEHWLATFATLALTG